MVHDGDKSDEIFYFGALYTFSGNRRGMSDGAAAKCGVLAGAGWFSHADCLCASKLPIGQAVQSLRLE